MLRKVRLQGFSLLEVSISLLIVGIISVISISQMTLMQKISASQKTRANIEFVAKVLGMYYFISKTQPLPFPSEINSNIGYQSERMKNSFGIIPYKTLGIMEKFAKDGNGRWLLYKMNPNFDEYSSTIRDDRLAFIIKAKNAKNEDEVSLGYDLQGLRDLKMVGWPCL